MPPIEPSKNGLTIDCNAVFDISVVTDFKATLQQAMAGGQAIVLDASKVERIDTAALQLLTVLCQDSVLKGIDVSWVSPSEPLTYAAKLTGLDGILRL